MFVKKIIINTLLTTVMAMLLLFLFAEPQFNKNYLASNLSVDTSNKKCLDSSAISNSLDTTIVNVEAIIAKKADSVKTETKYHYGIASFYSANLEGTETSTQEIFTHKKLTCASNRFKLNTWLRVTNIKNNKSIIVRVNDRMHPRMDAKGRVVDLSYLGAKKLDFIEDGITKVKVEVVEKGTKI